jgi:hypothetical protein
MTEGLRSLLETLDAKSRDDLRRVLIRDQADRDAIALPPDALPRSERAGLGRHHRLPEDVAGGAATSGAAASRAGRKRRMRRTPTGDGQRLLVAPVEARHQWIRHLRREGRDGFAMTIGVTAREYRETEAGGADPEPGHVPADLRAVRLAADVRWVRT